MDRRRLSSFLSVPAPVVSTPSPIVSRFPSPTLIDHHGLQLVYLAEEAYGDLGIC